MVRWRFIPATAVFTGVAIVAANSAVAQTPPPADPPPVDAAAPSASQPPAASGSDASLPPVDVIQQQPRPAAKPKPRVVKAKPKPKPRPASSQQPPPPSPEPEFVQQEPAGQTRSSSQGRLTTNAAPGSTPVNADSILPQNLQNYSGAATRVDPAQLDEQRPVTMHEALANVPGVVTVTDDGLSRNAGIGIRGSNFRRSRKVLVMEDGVSINFSSYIDPSTHYTPPMDRIENVEVIRGTVFAYGPLNNHGVVNFQSLSPFGKSETVIKGALIHTNDADQEWGNYRHVHTRQSLGNFGAVVAYTGGDASGAWDNERMRFNDFYGALGWKGVDQDLTISAVYSRERDDYDEDNFVGTRSEFRANGHRKLSTFGDDTGFNTYNADHRSLTIAHNYYVDPDTTVSTRLYARDHERNRFSARDGGPLEGAGIGPGGDPDDVGHMRGRNRLYAVWGADSRVEFANRPFLFGMTQDILAGVRYEHQSLRNCTSFGRRNQVLDDDHTGNCRATEDGAAYLAGNGFNDDGEIFKYESDSFAAFIQSTIHLRKNLSVTPGIRFESYDVDFKPIFDGGPSSDPAQNSEHDHVLPGISFAWEALPFTTLYGGYHRGFAPHIARDVEDFPLEEEVGDNFQIGLRSNAIKGFTIDMAYFHSFIDDYQIKEAFTILNFDNIFGTLDKVEINGFELVARLDTRPLTGGDWNLFGQVAYTFTNAEIERGQDSLFEEPPQDVSGNRLPFSIRHFANLTAGVGYKDRWDASITWTYRGDYFTNAVNSNDFVCLDEDENIDVGCGDAAGAGLDELIGGKVESVWLLSARANFKVTEQLSLFVSGSNLTDKLYVSDLSDGAKPGQGRTIMGGFTLRFD